MKIILTEYGNDGGKRSMDIPFTASADEEELSLCVVENAPYDAFLDTEGEKIRLAALYLGQPPNEELIARAYGNQDMLGKDWMPIKSKRLFTGSVDVLHLSLAVIYEDNRQVVLRTPDILCGFSSKSDEQNICNMVRALLECEDLEVNDAMYGTPHSSVSMFYEKEIAAESHHSLKSYTSFLKEIVLKYRACASYLRHKAHSRIVSSTSVMPMEQVRRISLRELQWLSQNASSLERTEHRTGIRVAGKDYDARLIQSSCGVVSYDVYENQVVCSFLFVVYNRARRLLTEEWKNINRAKAALRRYGAIRSDVGIPILTLKQYAIATYSKELNEFSKCVDELEALFLYYRTIFKCRIIDMPDLPRATVVLLRRSAYHEIYELIVKWFKLGNMKLAGSQLVFDVKNASKLFEYYCLMRLLKKARDEGFEWDLQGSARYSYPAPNPRYLPDRELNNTYVLARDGVKLTLYYAPLIYGYLPLSEESEQHSMPNGLTLYRTTRGDVEQNFWEPDFVMAVEHGGRRQYVVLDAKYSYGQSIISPRDKQGALSNIIAKYYLETAAFHGDGICMVWTLQGRSERQFVNLNESSGLLERYGACHSFGNCSINTDLKIDCMDQLWEEIGKLIPELNTEQLSGANRLSHAEANTPPAPEPSDEGPGFVTDAVMVPPAAAGGDVEPQTSQDARPSSENDFASEVSPAENGRDVGGESFTPSYYREFWASFQQFMKKSSFPLSLYGKVAPPKSQYDNIVNTKTCFSMSLELPEGGLELGVIISPNKKKRTKFSSFWERLKDHRLDVEENIRKNIDDPVPLHFEWRDYRGAGELRVSRPFFGFESSAAREAMFTWFKKVMLSLQKELQSRAN